MDRIKTFVFQDPEDHDVIDKAYDEWLEYVGSIEIKKVKQTTKSFENYAYLYVTIVYAPKAPLINFNN